MIRKNYFFLAILISISVHFSAFYNFNKQITKKERHVVVMDLSTYKEFSQPKEIKKPEKKVEKILPLKKIIPIEKKLETKKKEITKTVQKPKKKVEKKFSQKTVNKTSLKKDRVLIDKELSGFLRLISNQINHLAAKSYPLQSIKRREQGTILALITLNQNGKLIIIEIEKERPRRLAKATKTILKNYKFPSPPKVILDENNEVKIKIPVNFILRN